MTQTGETVTYSLESVLKGSRVKSTISKEMLIRKSTSLQRDMDQKI